MEDPHVAEPITQLRAEVDWLLERPEFRDILAKYSSADKVDQLSPELLLLGWRMLTPLQRHMLRHYLGINGRPLRTLAAIAGELGVDPSVVSQTIRYDIMRDLRDSMWPDHYWRALTVRLRNMLLRHGLRTPADLHVNVAELVAINGFGISAYHEVEAWLKLHGYPSLEPIIPAEHRRKVGLPPQAPAS